MKYGAAAQKMGAPEIVLENPCRAWHLPYLCTRLCTESVYNRKKLHENKCNKSNTCDITLCEPECIAGGWGQRALPVIKFSGGIQVKHKSG
jgi:hypothetical protein